MGFPQHLPLHWDPSRDTFVNLNVPSKAHCGMRTEMLYENMQIAPCMSQSCVQICAPAAACVQVRQAPLSTRRCSPAAQPAAEGRPPRPLQLAPVATPLSATQNKHSTLQAICGKSGNINSCDKQGLQIVPPCYAQTNRHTMYEYCKLETE